MPIPIGRDAPEFFGKTWKAIEEESGALQILIAHCPISMMPISEDEYEEIEFGVDSGASDTAVGPAMPPVIKTGEGANS